jgi:hypothetical protein
MGLGGVVPRPDAADFKLPGPRGPFDLLSEEYFKACGGDEQVLAHAFPILDSVVLVGGPPDQSPPVLV